MNIFQRFLSRLGRANWRPCWHQIGERRRTLPMSGPNKIKRGRT